MERHTYSDNDFMMFVSYCKTWVNKFGITEYQIDFKHHKIDSAARCTYDVKAKLACFQLTTEIEYDFCNQNDLNKLALHEVLHLLLAEFGYTINETKDYYSDLAIASEHSAVTRLINAILDDD